MESGGRKNFKEPDDSNDAWIWLFQEDISSSFLCITVFAFLVRVIVSLHPYSGAGNPPKYGDYEAQRHWMEITLNLPAREWYRNSTTNDLSYWGLDYPPLTAYQSYAHAVFLRFFDPDSVTLFASRGYESCLGKLLMRWTVLSSDILVFFPTVLYYLMAYHDGHRLGQGGKAWHLAMILLNPCLILIDHGHFQFNCISLGLTVGAVAAIFSKNKLVACSLFSLALNHKQMSAYLAPAFFGHLLGKCLKCQKPLLEVLKLGFVVLGVFALIWSPFLYSKDSVLEVLFRLAPFERGIYEDYVANFWCATSMLIKWKRLFTTESLKLLSLSATVLSVLPSMVQQIMAPSDEGFLYALLNSALSFYLFSFQVHEKSILLPLLPASLLAVKEPHVFRWLTYSALLSMYPLICRDHLLVPYVALFALFILLYYSPGGRQGTSAKSSTTTWKEYLMTLFILCSLTLHVIYLTMHPPEKYPFLFEALIMLLCFTQFMLLAVYTNVKQWILSRSSFIEKKKKLV